MRRATTETEYLLGQIEDLAMALATGSMRGDDGQQHTLVLKEAGNGHTEPQEAWYTCTCDPHWVGGQWMQTGYPDDTPPGEDPMDGVANAWAWLHHVRPSRYGGRPSTIMGETLRAMRERQAHEARR